MARTDMSKDQLKNILILNIPSVCASFPSIHGSAEILSISVKYEAAAFARARVNILLFELPWIATS